MEIPLRELRENGKEIREQSYELEDGEQRPTMVRHSLFCSICCFGGGGGGGGSSGYFLSFRFHSGFVLILSSFLCFVQF